MIDDNFEIKIPEVNSESGLRLCCGNRKIYIKSLRLFVTNIPATLAKMRALTENDLKNYSTSVHSVKGMCVYIGAEEAATKAKQLENMADAGDFKGVFEQNEIFIGQIEKITGSVQTWLNGNSAYLEKLEAGRVYG